MAFTQLLRVILQSLIALYIIECAKHMKMRLLFISVFIFGISISVLAQDLIHTDSKNGFNVATPEGWSDIDLAGRMVWHVASNNGV